MPCRAILLLALLCDGLICEGLCITNVIGLALVGLCLYIAEYGRIGGEIRTGVDSVMGWAS